MQKDTIRLGNFLCSIYHRAATGDMAAQGILHWPKEVNEDVSQPLVGRCFCITAKLLGFISSWPIETTEWLVHSLDNVPSFVISVYIALTDATIGLSSVRNGYPAYQARKPYCVLYVVKC